MGIDWDGQCFAPVHAEFGDAVTYIPVSGLPFPMTDVIFEEQYQKLTILDDNSAITIEQPAMTVRLAEFPNGSTPRQNDRVTIVETSATYVVREVQPGNHGSAKLMLQLVGQGP